MAFFGYSIRSRRLNHDNAAMLEPVVFTQAPSWSPPATTARGCGTRSHGAAVSLFTEVLIAETISDEDATQLVEDSATIETRPHLSHLLKDLHQQRHDRVGPTATQHLDHISWMPPDVLAHARQHPTAPETLASLRPFGSAPPMDARIVDGPIHDHPLIDMTARLATVEDGGAHWSTSDFAERSGHTNQRTTTLLRPADSARHLLPAWPSGWRRRAIVR
jgi:hypothetical protein